MNNKIKSEINRKLLEMRSGPLLDSWIEALDKSEHVVEYIGKPNIKWSDRFTRVEDIKMWKEIKEEKVMDKPKATVIRFSEAGEEFIGTYLEEIKYSNQNGEGTFYKFKAENGDEEFIIFPTTVISTKMSRVEPGTTIKLVYLGKKPSKKNTRYNYKDFALFVK